MDLLPAAAPVAPQEADRTDDPVAEHGEPDAQQAESEAPGAGKHIAESTRQTNMVVRETTMVKTASPAARRELGRVKAMGQNSMLAMAQSLSTEALPRLQG